ncbi:MAG: hypothetical protein PHT44_03815 [Candidatus Portnoybacteria bacterium]|nr:hypothetical protein [Candidatus Portnoybacteria bacterium]MDD4983047.1 hypothetical protein [Candidatus Portnoybacteria bacterium]
MTYHKQIVFADRQKGNIALSAAIIFGLFLMSVLYLAQINSLVARNFELRAVQNSLKAKQDANQAATISLMRVRSMNSLENAAKDLNLVAIEKVEYLKTVPGFFALSQKP